MRVDGQEIAKEILNNLKVKIEKLKVENIIPNLAIVLVGDNPASISYINQKKTALEAIGGYADIYSFKESAITDDIINTIIKIQSFKKINGLIVQLPLPKNLDTDKILKAIDPNCDVDGFLPNSHFTPPIAKAIDKILNFIFHYQINAKQETSLKENNDLKNWLKSKIITVIGKGETGGKPINDWLNKNNLNHYELDSKTENINETLKSSDIIISAVGKENFQIREDQLKDNVILIGVGLRKNNEGKFIGDYDTNEIKFKALFYTSTLGGVGPINVACLLENLVLASEK